jgi:peptide deformylase
MAIRNIRTDDDPILRKTSREINEINERLLILIEDMKETMYANEGIGLAAPQVGILKRVVMVDIGKGINVFINPEIVNKSDETDLCEEGCLSLPGQSGEVERPVSLKLNYMDIDGKIQEQEFEGLMARAVCHEIDHLNGILFIDKIVELEQL